jgi:pectate lyase
MRFPSSPWRAGRTVLGALIALALPPAASAQSVLLTDNFEDGVADGWTIHQGSWSVVADGTRVYRQSGTSSRYRSSAGSAAWTDYSVQARVKPTSWNGSDRFAAVFARFRDTNNTYLLALRSSNRVELRRISGGSASTLAQASLPVPLNTWYLVRLEATGSTLRGFVNGALLLTATDSALSSGRVAVGTDYASASFDDVAVTSGSAPPANQAPRVQAGVDQTVTLPAAASLAGTVTDDGLPSPPGAVTCAWTRASGPGTVTFSPSAAALNASASFSAAGSYVLTLACSDSQLSASDSLAVTVRRPDDPPPPPTDGPIGFASVNALGQNGTTGGAGGPTVVVTTAAQLEDYVGRPGPHVILISGRITLDDMITVVAHKSILGIGSGAEITGGGLQLGSTTRPGNNVIIRNILFSNASDDSISVTNAAHHVWVDHCEFTNGFDGALDIKRQSDFVTVSWNRFFNHAKTSLVGHSDSFTADVGHLRVTYHHNFFDGTGSRHPRVRFADPVHVFSNYYRNLIEYGIASTENAGVLVEGNYFENVAAPCFVGFAESGPGDLVQRGNVFLESGPCQTRGDVVEPSTYYSYELDDTQDLRAAVMAGAGVGRLSFGEQP